MPYLVSSAGLQEVINAEVTAARAILDPWQAQAAMPGHREMCVVYWTPSDRPPEPEYRERLTRIMKHIQAFYAREMDRLGFGPLTFNLKLDPDDLLHLYVVKGKHPYAEYDKASGNAILKECSVVLTEAGITPNRETLLIFCNMGDWDEEKKTIRHKSPYYARGNHKAGVAWQLDHRKLDTLNLTDKTTRIQDGEYGRISLGKHNSIFIGGVAHELGHALGLPHNKARADEAALWGTALMGAGNRTYADEVRGEGRGSFLTLAHGYYLASHPQFSGSVKEMTTPPGGKFTRVDLTTTPDGFSVTGEVTSTIPVYAVVVRVDPEGHSDYDALTFTAVPDASGKFSLNTNHLPHNKSCDLTLLACHANGDRSKMQKKIQLDEKGALVP